MSGCQGHSAYLPNDERSGLPTFRFSGRTYPKVARIVRELCAVAGRCCQPVVAAVAITVAVTPTAVRGPAILRGCWRPGLAEPPLRGSFANCSKWARPRLALRQPALSDRESPRLVVDTIEQAKRTCYRLLGTRSGISNHDRPEEEGSHLPGLRAPVASGGPEMQPVVRLASWPRLRPEGLGAGCLRVYGRAVARSARAGRCGATTSIRCRAWPRAAESIERVP